jgi:hypothetical protein
MHYRNVEQWDPVWDTDFPTRTCVTWWPFSPAREGSAKIDPHRDRPQTESLRGGPCRQWTNFMCHRQSNSGTHSDLQRPEAIESSIHGKYRIEREGSKTGIILTDELLTTQEAPGNCRPWKPPGNVDSVQAMKAYWGAQLQRYAVLPSALDWGEGSALHPGCFTPEERARRANLAWEDEHSEERSLALRGIKPRLLGCPSSSCYENDNALPAPL